MGDLTWVERTLTIDAVDTEAVRATEANPGWRLIGTGMGTGGQTTLTYGWPWPGDQEEVDPGEIEIGPVMSLRRKGGLRG